MTEEQWREVILTEEQVAKLLAVRESRKERAWIASLGTAVVTVALTSWGTYCYQADLNEREYEFQRTTTQLDLTRQTIREVNDMVSGMLKMNEERLKAAQGQFRRLSPAQRRIITDGTNLIQQQWRRERSNAEMMVLLQMGEDSAIPRLWSIVRDTVEIYTTCAEQVYEQYQRAVAPADACAAERATTLGWRDSLRSAFYDYYVGLLRGRSARR